MSINWVGTLPDGYRIGYRPYGQTTWILAYPGEDFTDPSHTLLGVKFCIWRHRRRLKALRRMEGRK